METKNLEQLRSLRTQEKAIKARIDEISTEATNEAVAILAAKGLDRGEFEIEGVGTFQLQRTDVFDLADYNKYKGEEAVGYRKEAKKKIKAQSLTQPRQRTRRDQTHRQSDRVVRGKRKRKRTKKIKEKSVVERLSA